MAKINLTVDGKQVSVESGTTVLNAAKAVGIEIPSYCYHPGLSIAGNCRMCLVEVEKMPKPVASCTAPVQEGMVVKTNTENVIKMRKSVMEFLLINHPLDCPTCDQAGECRLQDYYMEYDRIPSRFEEDKVHKDKMVDLGGQVMLDQERCIACTRCIRFCREVAHQDELTLANRGDHVTITTFPGKKLSNPYAGCTVDVCPVGALTSKDFRFKKRVWFLKSTPSVCPGCSRGCNIEIQYEESHVYRLLPRYNPEVNQYWMCDEGRYGYHSINEGRVLRPRIQTKEKSDQVSSEEALHHLVHLLNSYETSEIAVVAHAHETLETLEAFSSFAKNILQTDQLFYSRHEPAHPSTDDILITADKNPNQITLNRLGFKPFAELKGGAPLLILNNLSEKDLKQVREKKNPILAVWAQNESLLLKKAQVVLPIPSYAEQDGHFVNVQEKTQKIKKAFDPLGESRLAVEWIEDLAALLHERNSIAKKLNHAIGA